MSYVPTSQTIEQLICNLKEALSIEVSIPGNWSPILFFKDLKQYPCKSKDLFLRNFREAWINKTSYLDFFEATRGFKRTEDNTIWDIFNKGSIMIFAEDLFLILINKKEWTEKG